MWAWVIEFMIAFVKIGLLYKRFYNLRLIEVFYI